MRIEARMIAASVLLGCAAPERALPQYECVIDPPDADSATAWHPTVEQTRELATALPDHLARSTKARSRGIGPLDAYVCIYRGTTFEGQRAITAEFLSRHLLQSVGMLDLWKTGELGIDGHGGGVFEVTFLPDTGEFVALWINATR